MFDFQTMDEAREVAATILAEVFTPAARSPESAAAAPQGLEAKLERPVSRRGFVAALLRHGSKG